MEADVIVLRSGHRVQTKQMLAFLEAIEGVHFVGAFRNAINEGSGVHYDLQLGTGFIGQWHTWKTGGNKALNRAIQRVTEHVRRLIGARTVEITASNELKTLQVIIDGRPYKLLELGAGMTQWIVSLGNALIGSPSFG